MNAKETEEFKCPNKYVYDTGIIFECKDHIKVEIVGEDVADLLNRLYYELKGSRLREDDLHKYLKEIKEENEELKQQKPFLKIIDDYFIQYEDGELFNLHKPSDIRSLMHILNRGNGYSELQCEYNDLGKGDVE